MKIDIKKEARKRADEDASKLTFETIEEMHQFIVARRNYWAKRLYASDTSRN